MPDTDLTDRDEPNLKNSRTYLPLLDGSEDERVEVVDQSKE